MEVKNVKDLMKAYSDVYAQSEETLDENVQDAVKGALDAGAKFMKTNPVGKAVGAVIAPVGKGTGTVTASQQKQKISQNQNEEFDQVDEGRNTSLQALSRESERRKADKKRGRPETESETHSRLMMGKFRPGASKEERAEGGRQVLRDRGKVPKKGGKDMFEHILEHLVAEGYADTNESAIAIMANMSEEWRESILIDEGLFGGGGRVSGIEARDKLNQIKGPNLNGPQGVKGDTTLPTPNPLVPLASKSKPNNSYTA
jgi:hypothetical protein